MSAAPTSPLMSNTDITHPPNIHMPLLTCNQSIIVDLCDLVGLCDRRVCLQYRRYRQTASGIFDATPQ